jgi:hypothetical protein
VRLVSPTSLINAIFAGQLIINACIYLVTRVLASYKDFWQMCRYADEKNNGGHMPGCCHGENVSHVFDAMQVSGVLGKELIVHRIINALLHQWNKNRGPV